MGSKERIARLKEETRSNILKAAFEIVKEDGWNGLSMRKIADRIEYTAPIIYEYFTNKEAILNELTSIGFKDLDEVLKQAQDAHGTPEAQLEAMWMAFWEFGLRNREIYQVMFGVEMTCCIGMVPEAQLPSKRFCPVITKLLSERHRDSGICQQKYFSFFSVIHGLLSINLVGKGLTQEMNKQILKDAIIGIIKTI
ncbi:TetR/AcrR family transcriptional regulator [Algoriphagus sp. AGSA1]|uniref:TetR/AcrR family transcriptional regulator n=1 Tax=Algoriphagus sp. AGSA1 TaxID=2907213 RepID=UPI001F242755|nr:TetR/AcrR family transcriptional regulator [Algoriphagus sp. AGSA1]MCE7053448.1 TetR/AcrR family transcriptional regulator [Algoriphagus sp. AGSA1]